MIAVLDDDPTGSQTVHGVPIVLALDDAALTLDAETTFFLTNTRSLPEAEAAELTERVARRLLEQDPDLEVVSRSDSTLRGHVGAEVEAIERVRRAVAGNGYDAVLLVPAFFEAGRLTRDDVHWAGDVPVGETEFARDATFGYRSSNLLDFVRERCGDVAVTSLSLDEIRGGRAAERLSQARGWIVVNAEGYDDLDAVVRGIRESGRTFLYRTGPSFVRALAGIEPIEPLTAEDIWPEGRSSARRSTPAPRGCWPRAGSPRTTSRSAGSASAARRCSASCWTGWCPCSGRSRPTSAPSEPRTSCSPATSATRARCPRSCNGSGPRCSRPAQQCCSKDPDVIDACLALGYSSVMIDGSHLPFEDNFAVTRRVVERHTPPASGSRPNWARSEATRTAPATPNPAR